eukprot:scaffold2162_cov398-Prasinococcus_capsulatus_cf.AAC.28
MALCPPYIIQRHSLQHDYQLPLCASSHPRAMASLASGSIGAGAVGAALPLLILVFGDLVNAFGNDESLSFDKGETQVCKGECCAPSPSRALSSPALRAVAAVRPR